MPSALVLPTPEAAPARVALTIDDLPCPVVVTDLAGVIMSVNANAVQVIGSREDAWVGQPLDALLPLPSRMFMQTHVWPMLVQDGSVREIHLQLHDAQRQRLPVMVNCDRRHIAQTECWVWVFFIASERSRFEAELLNARKRAADATASVEKREHFLRTITNAVPGQVGYWDRDLKCCFANTGYLEWFGRPLEAVIGAAMHTLMDASTLSFSQPYIDAVLQGKPQRFERSQTSADGSRQTYALVNYIPDFGTDHAVTGFFVLVIDITQVKQAEGQLRLAASVVENTVDAIMITDEADVIVSVNPAFTTVTGYAPDDAVGQPASLLDAGDHSTQVQAQLEREREHELAAHGRWKGERWVRQRGGHVFLVSQAVTQISAAAGVPARRVTIFSDITERWRKDERLRHLAFHDPLTDLPNRMLLLERLGQLIGQTDREDRRAAVIFIDLDRFKAVNDSLGHAIGDRLLKAVAADLQALVRQSDVVARLGGDEFVVLLDNPAGRAEVEVIAQRIVECAGQPRHIEGHALNVGASLGVALFPQDALESEPLIACADTALYAVKSAGRNGFRFFGDLTDMEKSQQKLADAANQSSRLTGGAPA